MTSQAETQPIGQPEPRRQSLLEQAAEAQSLQFLALLALFTIPALLFIHNFYATDPDFGWHLRAGQWIVQNHAVPRTDPFSVYGRDRPWVDYSWLFDIFFAKAYRAF